MRPWATSTNLLWCSLNEKGKVSTAHQRLSPALTERTRPGQLLDQYGAMDHDICTCTSEHQIRPVKSLYSQSTYACWPMLTYADLWSSGLPQTTVRWKKGQELVTTLVLCNYYVIFYAKKTKEKPLQPQAVTCSLLGWGFVIWALAKTLVFLFPWHLTHDMQKEYFVVSFWSVLKIYHTQLLVAVL